MERRPTDSNMGAKHQELSQRWPRWSGRWERFLEAVSGEGVIGGEQMVQAVNTGPEPALCVERHRAWLELKPLGERHTDPFDNVMAAEDPPKKNAHNSICNFKARPEALKTSPDKKTCCSGPLWPTRRAPNSSLALHCLAPSPALGSSFAHLTISQEPHAVAFCSRTL